MCKFMVGDTVLIYDWGQVKFAKIIKIENELYSINIENKNGTYQVPEKHLLNANDVLTRLLYV